MYYFYCLDDWKSDQYRWANNGIIKLPRSRPIVRKSYYSIDTPELGSNGFTRHAYVLLDNDDKVSNINTGVLGSSPTFYRIILLHTRRF